MPSLDQREDYSRILQAQTEHQRRPVLLIHVANKVVQIGITSYVTYTNSMLNSCVNTILFKGFTLKP